jgi:hypothetical protein
LRTDFARYAEAVDVVVVAAEIPVAGVAHKTAMFAAVTQRTGSARPLYSHTLPESKPEAQ